MKEVVIRSYRKEDKPHLLELFMLNVPEYFDSKELLDYEVYLEKLGSTYLVIEYDHSIAGGAGYVVEDDKQIGVVTWIFFDPKLQGKGLGKAAVDKCLALLSLDDSVKKFTVNTSQHAFRFFEKFGYNTVRIEKDHWAPGMDLYAMEMPKEN